MPEIPSVPRAALASFALFVCTMTMLPSEAAADDWLVAPASAFPAKIVKTPDGHINLENGTLRRTFTTSPDAATIRLVNLTNGQELIRSVRPEASLRLFGVDCPVGGLTGQSIGNFLKATAVSSLMPDAGFYCRGWTPEKPAERFPYKARTDWMPQTSVWPPHGIGLCFHYRASTALLTKFSAHPEQADAVSKLEVDVHYELYDGIPLIQKWVAVRNAGMTPVRIETFTAETLAVPDSDLPALYPHETNAVAVEWMTPLHVVTDYAFGGEIEPANANPAVSWKADPTFPTGSGYGDDRVPTLLECRPPLLPGIEIAAGKTFTSFRVFELALDSADRERRGLAKRRMMRTIAPWTQENPILMHVRNSDPASVHLAIDQCANVGFEMIIMTFGSGFDIENESPAYRKQLKDLADYAHARGIALGGYSLLASRGAAPADRVINPSPRFGESPCLGSVWGLDYFRKLRSFFAETGMDVLENDGSYPGDTCASTTHPGHHDLNDSQWRQWEIIRDFYQDCRTKGIYLNVPDWYFLEGSNKTGMGYVETNWSLPRADQEIIERQNVYDGTFEKTPSMGWMFVPLTQYHGGGAAATIEPLADHLDHYEARLANLFGAGVQACYRGPRLYDTPKTEGVVKRWVSFYKAHRAILDSDIIHLRRADGRDWDGILHLNPKLHERGLAMLYNPLSTPIKREIKLPLYYTGLTDSARIVPEHGPAYMVRLQRDYSSTVTVTIPANSRTWVVVSAP